MKRQPKPLISPLDVIALKQKVGQDDADAIALPLLLQFDMAHRGKGSDYSAHFLARHALIALTIGSKSGNRAFYDVAGAAYDAIAKACARQTEFLAFTTGEYRTLRRALSAYLRVLPGVEVGVMHYANARAMNALNAANAEAA